MKLYYSPGACSLATHIVLKETGTDHTLEKVDNAAKVTETGADFWAVNPKGKVPVLTVEGETLTEGPAILQYLGDLSGNEALAPKAGTLARARVNAMLNYVGTELHIAFSPLFKPTSDEAEKNVARGNVAKKFDWLEAQLADGRAYLTGGEFTIADAYAFVVSNWAYFTGISLANWPKLKAFADRVSARPAAQAAMRAEGLI
ncbi:MAG: glutathione transferase GstA [Rhodobacteraceae bacterium]|nr:glutathione transferase GstA [Paracoccaceae bacterium]